jgi:hypothetical protein
MMLLAFDLIGPRDYCIGQIAPAWCYSECIKSANALICADDRVALADFGLTNLN